MNNDIAYIYAAIQVYLNRGQRLIEAMHRFDLPKVSQLSKSHSVAFHNIRYMMSSRKNSDLINGKLKEESSDLEAMIKQCVSLNDNIKAQYEVFQQGMKDRLDRMKTYNRSFVKFRTRFQPEKRVLDVV